MTYHLQENIAQHEIDSGKGEVNVRNRGPIGAAVAVAGVALASAAQAADCSAATRLHLRGVNIDVPILQEPQTLLPDPNSAMTGSTPAAISVERHCLVEGKIDDRGGVGGRYGIRFQIRLPEAWNGRFLFQGGGGMDGFIASAIGSIPNVGSTAAPAISRGYAVVSMDGGHDGHGAEFARDQQARLDLAYVAIGRVTDTAKAIIRATYGREPDHSLFMGCSNGGREAMIAAQRYPTEFDGIVAGDPGFHLSAAALAQSWDVRQFMSIAPGGVLSKALTQDDLGKVSSAILAQCDALDGVADGLVNAPSQCRFDPERLRGTLADAKVDALRAVMGGPVGSDGRSLYSDWPYDPGIASPGWRIWKLGFSGTKESDALNVLIGSQSLPKLFMTPPRDMVDPMTMDFDQAAKDIAQMGAVNDATSTYLTTFAARGGKMVIFQGMADPVFSTNDLVRWYRQATADTGGNFARLYLVPGMTHCGGGPALDDFDPLTALEDWIRTGAPPEQIAATGKSFPGVRQPLCPYPKEAHLTGRDASRLESYTCR
jgi:feruloyl esterase